MSVTTLGARVVVIDGQHCGQAGKVVDYDRSTLEAVVLLDDGHECGFYRGEGLQYESRWQTKEPKP